MLEGNERMFQNLSNLFYLMYLLKLALVVIYLNV